MDHLARVEKRIKRTGLVCPICLTWYSGFLCRLRAGSRCNDYSQGQDVLCVGRLIPEREFARAEWCYDGEPAMVTRQLLYPRRRRVA